MVDDLGIEPSWLEGKRVTAVLRSIRSYSSELVCVGGIEPPVSRTRTERSTRLSHTQMSAARRDRTCRSLLVTEVKSLDFECRDSWITRESNAEQVVYQTTQGHQPVVILCVPEHDSRSRIALVHFASTLPRRSLGLTGNFTASAFGFSRSPRNSRSIEASSVRIACLTTQSAQLRCAVVGLRHLVGGAPTRLPRFAFGDRARARSEEPRQVLSSCQA